jgi:hypothetical protein
MVITASQLELDIFDALNLARTDPSSYVDLMVQEMQDHPIPDYEWAPR